MKLNLVGAAALSALSFLAGAPAQADLIIELGPANTQPPENLLFNEPGLAEQGMTVQGLTNNTGEVFDLEGHEELVTPAQGQARVDGVADSELDFLLVDALRAMVFFTEFEANLHVSGRISGTFTVTACDQLGDCASETFDLGSGENYFSVIAVQGQLIDTVQIQSTAEVDDVRQIRIGGVQELPQQVTEPSSLALMVLGLLALGMARRKRA